MTITITFAQLSELDACKRQRNLFMRLFGDKLVIKSRDRAIALATLHAEDFDWPWAALNLLKDTVRADYEHITATAWADYARLTPLGNYEPAAWADYERSRAATFASLFWAQAGDAIKTGEATIEAKAARETIPAQRAFPWRRCPPPMKE